MPEAPDRRASTLSSAQHMPPDPMARHASTPFAPAAPSPSPGQYQTHMTPQFQPPTPVMGGPPVHHTPMPAQQPPPSQNQMRPVHYQQQQVPQSTYTQSPVQSVQPQHMHPGFNQAATTTSRTAVAPGAGGGTPHSNMYNPPRPPEVYTLTEAVNEAFTNDIRHQFQCDSAGRLLFFTSAPLDRAHKGLSSDSASVGHSARYFAGRTEWLAERTRKRKLRDESDNGSKKRSSPRRAEVSKDDHLNAQAQRAVVKWFQNFSQDTALWTEAAGLQGWNRNARS